MSLLSKVFCRFFCFKPSRQRGKALVYDLYQVVFMTRIKIVTRPLNIIISMLPRRHTSLFNKCSVPADNKKIGRACDLEVLSGFLVIDPVGMISGWEQQVWQKIHGQLF